MHCVFKKQFDKVVQEMKSSVMRNDTTWDYQICEMCYVKKARILTGKDGYEHSLRVCNECFNEYNNIEGKYYTHLYH
jgi:hypothetical protein